MIAFAGSGSVSSAGSCGVLATPPATGIPLLPRIVEIDVDAPVPFEVDLEPEALQNLIENVARQR